MHSLIHEFWCLDIGNFQIRNCILGIPIKKTNLIQSHDISTLHILLIPYMALDNAYFWSEIHGHVIVVIYIDILREIWSKFATF